MSTSSAYPDPTAAFTTKHKLMTLAEIYRYCTENYLYENRAAARIEPDEAARNIITKVNLCIAPINAERKKLEYQPWSYLSFLQPSQIALILIDRHHASRIPSGGLKASRTYDLTGVYIDEGEDRGLYSTDEIHLRHLARLYNPELTINEVKEVISYLEEQAPRRPRCMDRDLIAVNNGVLNYRTKELLEFSPEMIFLAKSSTDWFRGPGVTTGPDRPKNPVIRDPSGKWPEWDIESWIRDLFDDPELSELIWQIIGAIIRPYVAWDKTAWFYSEVGNNGKGTLCTLMRNIAGEDSVASIPLTDFSKDFMLEPLIGASAIITDENEVGLFIDKAANLKAVVTNDMLLINRKNRVPVAHRFYGFMVQCLNEFPQFKDRSDSYYRRQLFVPFEKSFTGETRTEIKTDFLARPDVLQYVLWRVLAGMPDYYELDEPAATKATLDEYKTHNDPVRGFWNEFESEFVWKLLPSAFLYDLFCAWQRKVNPSGSLMSMRMFVQNLKAIIHSDNLWGYVANPVRPGLHMSEPEPLIKKYELEDWMNPAAKGSTDIDKLCIPLVGTARYRGLIHVSSGLALDEQDSDTP